MRVCPLTVRLLGVRKSEVIRFTLDPVWEFETKLRIPLGVVAVRIECWDWDRGSKNDFEGTLFIFVFVF